MRRPLAAPAAGGHSSAPDTHAEPNHQEYSWPPSLALWRSAPCGTLNVPLSSSANAVYSYAGLDGAVNRAAHALGAAGLRTGDRMLLMSGNSDRFILALYAALRLGALVVPGEPCLGGSRAAAYPR